jgi:hypothetical protein
MCPMPTLAPSSVSVLRRGPGGVLQYINFIGLNEFVKRSNELAAKHGERFTPPKLLIDMAAKGETFV